MRLAVVDADFLLPLTTAERDALSRHIDRELRRLATSTKALVARYGARANTKSLDGQSDELRTLQARLRSARPVKGEP